MKAICKFTRSSQKYHIYKAQEDKVIATLYIAKDTAEKKETVEVEFLKEG